MTTLTIKEALKDPGRHRKRHILLHKYLDELICDYLQGFEDQEACLFQSIFQFAVWSFTQTKEPSGIKHKYRTRGKRKD